MTDRPKSVAMQPCGECGMPCHPRDYHPYAACLMFKACRNSDVVRANLDAVRGAPANAGEPVAWMSGDWLRAITETELALIPNVGNDKGRRDRCRSMYRIPLYAAPPTQPEAASREPLSEAEIARIYERYGGEMINCTRAIERAHGIKHNEGGQDGDA